MDLGRTFANLASPRGCGGKRWTTLWTIGALALGSAGVVVVGACARTDDDVGDRQTAIEKVYGEETTDGVLRGGRDSAGVETPALNTSGPPDEPGVDGNGTFGDVPNPATTTGGSPDTITRPAGSVQEGSVQESTVQAGSAPADTRYSGDMATEPPEGSGVRCGARAGDTCAKDEYCAYEAGQLCGAADAEAVCRPIPVACTREYAPVCGCDGKTYANACAAAAAGTGVKDEGECLTESDCEHVQCLRAVNCAETCGGEIVQSGCCPCPEGMLDVEIDCRG